MPISIEMYERVRARKQGGRASMNVMWRIAWPEYADEGGEERPVAEPVECNLGTIGHCDGTKIGNGGVTHGICTTGLGYVMGSKPS
jgi:hypothetical protein